MAMGKVKKNQDLLVKMYIYIYRFVIAIRLSHVGIFTKTKKISRLIWRYDPKKGNSFKMRSSWFKKETHLVIL